MTKVSIIMTCHNGETYLREAIKSIRLQTYKKWELIFLDNNSSDSSKKIIKSCKDKRIIYFKSKITLNLGQARQLAFNKCSGDFICFLDVDDLWNRNKLKLQLKKFKLNKKADILYSKYFILKNNKLLKRNYEFLVKNKCKKEIIYSYIDGKPYTAWLTLMIKRKAIKSLKYAFDKKLHISTDFDLIYRLSKSCNFDYVNRYLASYRVHKKNESIKNKITEINDLNYIFKKIIKDPLFKKNSKVIKFSDKLFLKKFLFYKMQNKNFSIKNLNIKSYYYRFIYILIKILPKFLLKKLQYSF